jgi:aminopeptidase YwaD
VTDLIARTRDRLDALCLTYPDRHVGGPGVTAANALFSREAESAGFKVRAIPFDCVDWEWTGALLRTADGEHALHVGPYSPPFDGQAPLIAVESLESLESLEPAPVILLLHGSLAEEQITPRNYPFYEMPEHVRLLAALDRIAPAALIAATDTTPMAAAVRPFPLFEDAALGVPSAFTTVENGSAILQSAGEDALLKIVSEQRPARSEQVIARLGGRTSRRIVVSAHIDSRHGTPGALDNAGGVCVLLALAEMLGPSAPELTVELVPFNGEDNFAAYGEMAYLAEQGERGLEDIALAINLDAVGRRGDTTSISFYGADEEIRARAVAASSRFPGIAEGPEWPMSDHMVFAMRGVPAMAVTSSGLHEIAATVAHTAEDLPGLVDPTELVKAAGFIHAIIESLAD